ncbi:efflux RND transporter periplasmic adaptor subunit [Chrysiogenes arsenatis]|uniref:efflux RND transporter periplasmic adaptor subunit n=1 Tax=Chrysiogenes arsenatis TaxID=309797 RepID=UPI000484B028|nr:HlyD family efflux transporter periplasmic adaptor subunit [Chrysiogenes arsenatis]
MRLTNCIFFLLFLSLNVFAIASEAPSTRSRGDFRSFSPEVSPHETVAISDAMVGVVYPRERYLLAMAVSGVVSEVKIAEGAYVDQGTPLLVLEQHIEQLELSRLETLMRDKSALDGARARLLLQVEQVKSALELYHESRSISLDELNQMIINRVTTESEVALLELEEKKQDYDYKIGRQVLAQRTLLAPSKGFITQIRLKKGEWAQAGEPIIELVDTSYIYIRISIPSAIAAKLTIGQKVDFAVESTRAQGAISFLSPVADPASGLVEVKVEYRNVDNRFRPGLKARVQL